VSPSIVGFGSDGPKSMHGRVKMMTELMISVREMGSVKRS